MSLYSKKFIKFLNEQDEDQLTDPEAMQSTLEPETDAGDFDIDVPETADGSPVNSQQREMYDELSEWINRMDEFSKKLIRFLIVFQIQKQRRLPEWQWKFRR